MELNDQVVVKLTEIGAKILNEHNTKIMKLCDAVSLKTNYEAGEPYKDQLWSLFYVFGEHCCIGSEMIFTNLERIEPMDSIKQRQLDLAASLWTKPGTFEELKERDFLQGISEYSLDRLISWCESDGLIYEKNGKYYCFKKTVTDILNPVGYGLD